MTAASLTGKPSADDEPTRLTFAEVYTALFDPVFAFALMRSGNWQEAEELTQAVFADVYLRWEKLSRKSLHQLRPYLIGAVSKKQSGIWRRLVMMRRRESLLQAVYTDSVTHVEEEVFSNTLLRALDGLPPMQRSVAVLRWAQDYTPAEIGKELGISASTVRTHFGTSA